jgi:hypothetical protein
VYPEKRKRANKVKNEIIKAFEYPRSLVRCRIDIDECTHAGNYDNGSVECQDCQEGPECEWLCGNDEFVALEQKPLEELQSSLEIAKDYVYAQIMEWGHDSQVCHCDACKWLRMAEPLLERPLVRNA